MSTGLSISADVYEKNTTGKNVDELVMALLEAAGDREEKTRDSVISSLVKIGGKEPILVLVSCVRQLSRQDKLQRDHRIAVLHVMTELVGNMDTFPSPEVLNACIRVATAELLASKDIIPEWQIPASNVLVAAGVHDCQAVMDCILDLFKIGQLPHYFILHTVANLASENKFGFVKFLQEILNNFLPNLGQLRHDNMRYICAYTLGKFAEALNDYLANLDRAPDANVSRGDFLQSFNSAFDILATWLGNSKEAKLRAALMESIGYVSLLTARDKVELHLAVIVSNNLLPALKRQNEFTYPATQCLAMLIDSCNQNGSLVICSLADAIMSAMLVHLDELTDFSNPVALKTHNEMLRCFTLICFSDPQATVHFLLSKLEPKSPFDSKMKARVLFVLRHLVNTADSEIGERRSTLLISLREVVNDSDEAVIRALLQLVVSLADHGYFELEGSRLLTEYVVRQCASTPIAQKPAGKNVKQPDFKAISRLAASVLNLLTTTLPQVESALWPGLLEYFLSAKYAPAFGNVCKSLNFIGHRRLESGPYSSDLPSQDTETPSNHVGEKEHPILLDFSKLPDIPTPTETFARCLLMAADERELNSTAIHAIKFLDVFSPNLFRTPELTGWQDALANCLALIEAHNDGDEITAKVWESALMKVLFAAIDVSLPDNSEWIGEFLRAVFGQLDLYSNYSRSRCLFHLIVAGCVSRSVKRDFITKTVDDWFGAADHSTVEEQQAFGYGCGLAATTQLDIILSKIESGLKGEPLNQSRPSTTSATTKSSGFLSFFKELTKSDASAPNQRVKSSLLICMGNAVSAAPPSLAASRIESIVVPHLLSTSSASTKPAADAGIRHAVLLCMDTVAKALHPDTAGKVISLAKRDDLLTALRKFVKDEPANNVESDVRIAGIQAAAALVELDPVASEDLLDQLTSTLIASVFQQPESASSEVKFQTATTALVEYLLTVFAKLSQPMAGLEFLMKHLSDDKWLQSSDDWHRDRAMSVIAKVAAKFHETVVSGSVISSVADSQKTLTVLAYMFAIIIPRLADPNMAIRTSALDALVTCLQVLVHVTSKTDDIGSIDDVCRSIRVRVGGGEANLLHSAILDLAKLFCKLFSSDIKPLVSVLDLADTQTHGSAAACLVLHTIIKQRSNELIDMIPVLLDKFLEELARLIDVKEEEPAKGGKKTVEETTPKVVGPSQGTAAVQTGILRCCRMLAQLQLNQTLAALLAVNYPYPESVSCVWRYLAQDSQLAGSILDFFLDKLGRCVPYEEHKKQRILSASSDGNTSSSSNNNNSKLRPARTANIQPLLMLAALGDMFTVPDMEGKLMANYHHIFGLLLMFLSAYAGAKEPPSSQQPISSKNGKVPNGNSSKSTSGKLTQMTTITVPTPVSQVLVTLNNFLNSASSTDIRQAIDDVWPDFAKDDTVLEAIAKSASELGATRPKQMPKIANVLAPCFSSPYSLFRSAVASCLAAFIAVPDSPMDMVETLVSTIQGHLTDQCFDVRLYCYRGMGNVGSKDSAFVDTHTTSLVNCLLLGLDDRDDTTVGDIAYESLESLKKLLAAGSEATIRPIFVNIVVRVKVCFDNENASIRAASIRLFGELAKFSTGGSEVNVWEQAHLALVPIWIRLNDPDPDVCLASAHALLALANVIGAAAVVQLFEKALKPFCQQESTKSLHFVEFSSSTAALLAEYFAERMFSYYTQYATGYFQNNQSKIRSNAVTILGFLLANLPSEKHNVISKHHLCMQLIAMLKDSSSEVRRHAADAISLLAHY